MGFFSPSFFVILKQKSISRAYIQDLTCQRSLLGCVMMTLSWHLSSFLLLFLCAGKLLPDDLCLFLKHHCFCQPQNTSAHAEPHSWAGKLSLKLLFFLLTVICWTPFLIILELRFQFVLVFFLGHSVLFYWSVHFGGLEKMVNTIYTCIMLGCTNKLKQINVARVELKYHQVW